MTFRGASRSRDDTPAVTGLDQDYIFVDCVLWSSCVSVLWWLQETVPRVE